MPRMLVRAKLTLQDFDFYEIHEAFASQVLATLKAWEDPIFCAERLGLDQPLGAIDRDKLNVVGSSLAAGHPFAATGGRIVATLATLLAETRLRARPDLDLRRRRSGRHSHRGALSEPVVVPSRIAGRRRSTRRTTPAFSRNRDGQGGAGERHGGLDEVVANLFDGDRDDRGDAR